AGLNGVLANATGIISLALTAARKSERMLAKRLAVMPTAAGLTAASPALIDSMSSRMPAGSLASRIATRFTAERRSRTRVAESRPGRSRATNTVASVVSLAATEVEGLFRLGFLLMIRSFGNLDLTASGLGRTWGDMGDYSGFLPYHIWEVCSI